MGQPGTCLQTESESIIRLALRVTPFDLLDSVFSIHSSCKTPNLQVSNLAPYL